MNWNSRDRFSASFNEGSLDLSTTTFSFSPQNNPHTLAFSTPAEDDRWSSSFDPFSTIYDWTELNPPIDQAPTSSCQESDLENCESLFLEDETADGSFFDPLQTITDYEYNAGETEPCSEGDCRALETVDDDEFQEPLSPTGRLSDGCYTYLASPEKDETQNQFDEFVFVERENFEVPPSPSNNDINLDSYCFVSAPSGTNRKEDRQEPALQDEYDDRNEVAEVVLKEPAPCEDVEREVGGDEGMEVAHMLSNESSVSSVKSSSGPGSESSGNLSTSNYASSESQDVDSDHVFSALYSRDLQFNGTDATNASKSGARLPSVLERILLPHNFVVKITSTSSIDYFKSKEGTKNNRHLEISNPPNSEAATPDVGSQTDLGEPARPLIHVSFGDAKCADTILLPGLKMSDTVIVIKNMDDNKKRIFRISISKPSYVEKVYIRATNSLKNESVCFTQALPAGRFSTLMSGFTLGLKKLERIFPRLSLESSNVLNYENILEISSEDYDILKKMRRALEDALFFYRHEKQTQEKCARVRGELKEGVQNQNGVVSENKEAASERIETVSSFRSVRFLRSLSHRLSQHLLSREETVEVDQESQTLFKKEEIALEFMDECSLDISICNIKSATNLKLSTKLYCTLFLNRPFRLTVAVNDRRHERQKRSQSTSADEQTAQGSSPKSMELVTVKNAIVCSQALADYSDRRELVLDDRNESIIGQQFEAMRIKLFSENDLDVESLPLRMLVRLNINRTGQIRFQINLLPRCQCTNILIRFPLPHTWSKIVTDSLMDEARNCNHRFASIRFSRLQSLFSNQHPTKSNVFDVTYGEAWFNKATDELTWKIEQLPDHKGTAKKESLLLRLSPSGLHSTPSQCNNDTEGTSSTEFMPINRFVKAEFTAEDFNLSKVQVALVRRDRMTKGKQINQELEIEPEIVTRHNTKFEYCVEIDVKSELRI